VRFRRGRIIIRRGEKKGKARCIKKEELTGLHQIDIVAAPERIRLPSLAGHQIAD